MQWRTYDTEQWPTQTPVPSLSCAGTAITCSTGWTTFSHDLFRAKRFRAMMHMGTFPREAIVHHRILLGGLMLSRDGYKI